MKNRKRPGSDGIVYSTEHGRMCPGCGRPAERCKCCAEGNSVPDGRNVRVVRETKGRCGKVVTVITGLPLSAPELKELAKKIKAMCGAGGKVGDGAIEVQGDHVRKVRDELARLGWTAKKGVSK